MTVIDTGMKRDLRANAVIKGWLIKRACSWFLGAHGVMLVELSRIVEEPNLSCPSDC